MRHRVWVGLAAAAGALLVAGTALATGVITVKGIGGFGVGDEVGYASGHTFTANIAAGTAVNTVLLRVPPGAAFPWHYHPAALTVTVVAGRFTLQDAGTCDKQTFSAGQGFVEEAGVVHRATNTGADLVVLYVTYLGVPAGQPGNVFEPASYDPC
jgi:quercetin dioxygenase-like cupin family protein